MRRLNCVATLTPLIIILIGSARSYAALTYNAENRPTSIDSLSIAGTTYQVTINYGVSFDSQFGDSSAPVPVPTFWQDESGALQAVAAMAAALNAESPRPLANTTLVVPTASGTWFFGDYVDGVEVDFAVGDPLFTASMPLEGVRLDPHVPDDSLGWPLFTPIPEPSGATLLAIAGAAAALRRLCG